MTLQRAAVTGASGRIGAPLVGALVAAGVSVRALSRRPQAPQQGVEWLCGDLLDAKVLAELVAGADTVFHAGGLMAGSPDAVMRSLVHGTELVLQAASRTRLIHLSSLVVLDTSSSAAVIDVNSPLEPTPERRGVYTQAKAAAEVLVRAAAGSQDVVIARPGLVMGSGPNPMPLAVALRAGPFWIPVGPERAELPVVEAESVAKGLLAAAQFAPSGAVVHLIDSAPVTRRQLFDRLRDGANPGILLPIGSLVSGLAIAAMAASDAAYRVVAAGRPHRWTASQPAS